MTKRELKELIRSTINEYMGTGASGGNATDGNDMTSQRIGGSFKTEKDEPQPQVVVAFGFRITNCAPSIPSE